MFVSTAQKERRMQVYFLCCCLCQLAKTSLVQFYKATQSSIPESIQELYVHLLFPGISKQVWHTPN
uniref:Uncharacterized protein n=1 Tax=Anguilla anguilla TaxID=7936 RepID=A0A0E9S722_ANGAN